MSKMPKFTPEFIAWLDECPCNWLWLQHEKDNCTYKFYFKDEETNDNDS